MKGLHLIPLDTSADFIGKRTIAFIFSTILMIGSIFLIATNGLNFGIDFTGGTVIEIRTPVIPDLQELRTELNELNLGSISIQEFGEPDDLLIRLPEQEGGAQVICWPASRCRAEEAGRIGRTVLAVRYFGLCLVAL